LQENHAQRSDYQKLENLVKNLREDIQRKELTIEILKDKAKSFEEESILKTKKIEEIEMEKFRLKNDNYEISRNMENMRSEEELKQFEIKKKANAYFEKQKREINQLRKENKKLEKQKNEYKDILNSIQKVFNIKAISNIKSRLKSIFEAKEGEKQAQEQQVQEQIYRKQKKRMRR
jgi:chromosome segregation ATPase